MQEDFSQVEQVKTETKPVPAESNTAPEPVNAPVPTQPISTPVELTEA